MENTEKLTNSKAVIAYIAEQFPNCFSVEGEAKPLKIGIFEDLAARLDGDTRVSKTQLRAALRQYTSSWRYLHGVKPGAVRVDLDGNACGELEEEHIEHARKALKKAKPRLQSVVKKKPKSNVQKTHRLASKVVKVKSQRNLANHSLIDHAIMIVRMHLVVNLPILLKANKRKNRYYSRCYERRSGNW